MDSVGTICGDLLARCAFHWWYCLGLLVFLAYRWVWVSVAFVGGVTAFFTMIACIIHFQILPAVGLFFVVIACLGVLGICKDLRDYPD